MIKSSVCIDCDTLYGHHCCSRSVYAEHERTPCASVSYYLTSFNLRLKREEFHSTVWSESCFTLDWIASSTSTRAPKCCSLVVYLQFEGWDVGQGAACDLEGPSVAVRAIFVSWPVEYSNRGPFWEPRGLLEKARAAVKSQLCSQLSWDVS